MRRLWVPISLGFTLGVIAGLYYAWALNPVEYVDTAPHSLREDFKGDYLALIASAYAGTGDLDRAVTRLGLLPEIGTAGRVSTLAEARQAGGYPASESRALAQLAADLSGAPLPSATRSARPSKTPTAEATQTPSPPTPTRDVTPTFTPTRFQSPTPTAPVGGPFQLLSREQVCDPEATEPLIQVLVRDPAGDPLPGVQVTVIWDAGEDSFFTGLKPEIGAGYADFRMQADVTYALQVAGGSGVIRDLQIADCFTLEGAYYPGSWQLIFQRPAAQ